MMEGNGCYKYSTVCNAVKALNLPSIRTAVDIGMNLADTTAELRRYFPEALIDAYEPVKCWYDKSLENLQRWHKEGSIAIDGIRLFNEAVSHLPGELGINFGLGGGCAAGGSIVTTRDNMTSDPRYKPLEDPVKKTSLWTVINRLGGSIDYFKIDCEGCEHSVIGDADLEALERIRFIGGEYHNIREFGEKAYRKLVQTHRINILGHAHNGSFFCARIGSDEDIFLADSYEHHGLRCSRFNPEFINNGDVWWHGGTDKYPAQHADVWKATAGRRFRYERVGYDQRELELKDNGLIGKGSSECERAWCIRDEGGEPVMYVDGGHGLTMRLTLERDGLWRGAWVNFEKMPIILERL